MPGDPRTPEYQRRVEDTWLTACRPNPTATLRLFCLPYAGGGASAFRAWARELPEAIEVCAVQLPGRETRWLEKPFERMWPLTSVLADVLAPRLSMPYALFGHSMGALVAFELTRELRRRRMAEPRLLVASAHRAPDLPSQTPPLRDLPEDQLVEEMGRLHGSSDGLLQDAEVRACMLPLIRADFAVCETYVYEPDAPLECPILAIGGSGDPHVSRTELEAWREHTRAGFALRQLHGGHFYLHTARSTLLRHLGTELAPPNVNQEPS
jgi:medium-chain acyl-[acyl-carrier-protein] hydrolase